MALVIASVLLFKLIEVACCFKTGPTYCCLAVPLLWHVCFTSTSFSAVSMPRLLRKLV